MELFGIVDLGAGTDCMGLGLTWLFLGHDLYGMIFAGLNRDDGHFDKTTKTAQQTQIQQKSTLYWCLVRNQCSLHAMTPIFTVFSSILSKADDSGDGGRDWYSNSFIAVWPRTIHFSPIVSSNHAIYNSDISPDGFFGLLQLLPVARAVACILDCTRGDSGGA